ncbi:MAG TPA: HAMP domain-containing sensor histidine kinase [Rhodocyclaceae bacterium]|nr:HAMP domain-containing sensor histidine kinase [Rhodocyclaceae bacterium]
MSLRSRIFLSIGAVYILLLGYVYAVWMPEAADQQTRAFHSLQERNLGTVGELLLPMVVAGQLGDIHDTLDALRAGNPEWLAVELGDARGRLLYPLSGTPAVAGGDSSHLLELPIRIEGNVAATLRVLFSDAPLLASIRAAQLRLVGALAIATLAALAFIALVLELAVRRPVGRVAEAAHELAKGNFDTPLPAAGDDEIGDLVLAFERMRREVDETQAGLKRMNETLAEQVRQEVAANRDKDHLLIQQSRLAAMGEMVHNIAHQWRQPLNSLGILLRNIRDDYDYGTLTADSLAQAIADAQRLLQRMSTTIDDFREFFRPDREKMRFEVGKAVRDAAFLVGSSLQHYNIDLQLDIVGEVWAEGFPSQFSQAVLNLIANAKEAIAGRRDEGGRIAVRVAQEGKTARVTVEDNGGGIPAEVLPRIFDPYFTTKEKGSGIGLYMTKVIIEKNMNGEVSATNIDGGARVELAIPAETDHG